jgi:nucleotide-binding universal stress UspA family protein
MFHKILVAIDGSDASHDVFKTALDLAKVDSAQRTLRERANLLILHVLSFEEQNSVSIPMSTGLEYFQAADSQTLEIDRERWQTYEQQSLNLLKSLVDRATAAGAIAKFHQISGGPGRKICEFAESEEIDLIVMGRRCLSGVNEFLVGSVSNYVLHHAPCSVLIDKKRSS